MASLPELQLEALLRRLREGGVDFVVIGGVAVNFQGYGRATKDLDITYATDRANLEALGGVLVALEPRLRGVTDEVPFVPDAALLRRVSLLTLDTSLGGLDLLVDPPGAPPYDRLRSAADRVDLDGVEVLVASLDDVLAMKAAAGRPQDVADRVALEEARRLRAERDR